METIKHRKHSPFSKKQKNKTRRQKTNYINYNKGDKLLKLDKNQNQQYNIDKRFNKNKVSQKS